MWDIAAENTEGRAALGVLITMIVIAAITYALRVWSCHLQKAALDASDYTCLLGLILAAGIIPILWLSISLGIGLDLSDLTMDQILGVSQVSESEHFFTIEIVWNAATVSVRISILLLYIRIFPIRQFKVVCWIIAGVNLLTLLSVILGSCLICRPLPYNPVSGYCGNMLSFEHYTAIWNLIMDSTMVILPMPMLWRLQMKRKKKIGLSIILGMGLVICIVTLSRVVISYTYDVDDFSKQASIVALFTGLEPTIGVITACLPFLPLVFQRIWQAGGNLRTTAFVRTFTRITDNNNGPVTSSKLRSKQSGSFKELTDLEMNSVKAEPSFDRSYIGMASQSTIPESGPRDEFDGRNRIIVRNDYLVEREPR